ncbi:MAG: SAF domain-containing protein [Aeromicrobium erythreum]
MRLLTLRRFVLDHRRPLAALCAALAVLAALASVRDTRDGPVAVVAAHDLPSGTVLERDDLTSTRLSPAHHVDGVATTVGEVVGRRTAGPMRRGEVVTDRRVVDPGPAAGRAPGTVLTTVQLPGPDALGPARVGDRVDVVAVTPDAETPARVVARGIEVVAVRAARGDGPVVVDLAASRHTALDLATVALESRLSLLVSTGDDPAD